MLGEDYDASCDVFSYGNVLAELITLQRPAREFWNRVPDNNYQLDLDELKKLTPRDCPKKFLDLCIRCVQYRPADRPGFTPLAEYVFNNLLDFSEILVSLKEIERDLPKEEQLKLVETRPQQQEEEFSATKRDSVQVSYLQDLLSRRLSLSSSEKIISEKHLLKMVQRGTTPDYYGTRPCFVLSI